MKGTDEKIGSNTYKISEHIPIAIGYSWHSKDEVLSRSYFGPDCIKDYVRDLLEIETKHCVKIIKAMLFTEEDKLYHDANHICHICNKNFVNKVRDHCHQTGRYRGPACNVCNLNYKHQNFIPLIFHNGKGYDFNLLFNEIFKQNNSKRRINILPSTNGKARMFRVGKFRDNYSFLTMSLEKIAKGYNIKNKTLYPYEYFKGENSCNNKLGNLSIQDFRSSLTTKLPTQDEVDDFNDSKSNNTGKELKLEYMENDIFIFILGHCFNLFVKLNTNTIKLNPLHYISLPSYSFDCFLKLSKVELDTIQHEQIIKDFISAMRGGICGVMGSRYVKSQSQSQSQRQRSIWYINANNLYGYALMQKLPYKNFEYTNTTLDKVLNTSDDIDYGYWLICDLDYTNECKERTSNFQLLPHGREVENNELGYKQRPPTSSKSKKLILDQNNKYEYPINYRMLKFVVRMGIKVTKVHRIIKFKQDFIIRDYIELNTKMRAGAKTEPQKDIFKLMKKSLFGKKLCESIKVIRS